jgi:hypothetical protein
MGSSKIGRFINVGLLVVNGQASMIFHIGFSPPLIFHTEWSIGRLYLKFTIKNFLLLLRGARLSNAYQPARKTSN